MVPMSESAQKCEIYSRTVVAFKMAYSCCFGLRGNIDFPDFLQKKF